LLITEFFWPSPSSSLHYNLTDSTEKEPDVNMKKEEREISGSATEEGFVIYDPDNPPFETLYLCKYLLELPELEEEGNQKAD
jgi:hypothetical protein